MNAKGKPKCPQCGSVDLEPTTLYPEAECIEGYVCEDCHYEGMDTDFEPESSKPSHTAIIFVQDPLCDTRFAITTATPESTKTWGDFYGSKTNARKLEKRMNSHDALVAVLLEIKHKIIESGEWWMDCPDRGGFDLEAIESALKLAGEGE